MEFFIVDGKSYSPLGVKVKNYKVWTCKQAKCIVNLKIVKFKTHKSLQEKVVRLSIERLTNMQKNTDIKSMQDDFDDDLNIELDEPLSYERFHRLLEHARQISNQEKDDEQ